MASEETSGALSGAASGAAAGAAFGPWGAVIGGVIGAVGGLLGGKKKKAAKRAAQQAAAARRQQDQLANAVRRRDLIRQGRAARAQAVAAGAAEGAGSSAVEGAVSSIDSQLTGNLTYFDTQIGLDNIYNAATAKAGKYAEQGASIDSFLGAAGGLITTGRNLYGAAQKPAAQLDYYQVQGAGATRMPEYQGYPSATTAPYKY